MKAEAGDSVRITTKNESYEGVLMPRPELLEQDVTIIKLSNGYNIGISNKRIEKVDVIKKFEQEKVAQKRKGEPKKNLPNVSILSFGGTISSKVDYRTGGTYADYTAQDFIEMMPELDNVANMKARKVMGVMSEDMNPDDWNIMAKNIIEELKDDSVDGIVVTQGTDTLHFSTAAMSFFLRNLNKPVIFTAAQRSIDRGSSDAFLNLFCAVTAAAKFDGAEVMTCMHATSNDNYCILIRGAKVKKMHTARRDAFRPINELPLAKIFENGNIKIINNNYKKRNKNEKVILDDKFETKTGFIYIYPGMQPDIFDYYIEKKYKGLVIAATALGHVPTINQKYSLIPKFKKLIDNGVSVVIASQTIYGRTHPYVYTNLRKLSVQLKCIFVEDTMPEVAYVKLGWVLGHTTKHEEVKKMMLTNYAGEISERSDVRGFLY